MSQNNNDLKLNKGTLIMAAAAGLLVIIATVLLIIESGIGGQYTITNKTDKNITGLTIYFDDEEGNMLDMLYEGSLKAGETIKDSYGAAFNFSDLEANLAMLVQFEGEEELYVFDGFFNSPFDGNFEFEFYSTDERPYCLYMTAYTGLFKNTSATDLKQHFQLYTGSEEEGFWDYIW